HRLTLSKNTAEAGLAPVYERLADEVTASLYEVVGLTASVPRAMWNPDPVNELSSDTVIPDVVVGLRLRPKPYDYDVTLPVPIENLQFARPGVSDFQWGNVQPPTQPQYCNVPQCTPREVITAEMNALSNPEVLQTRQQLLAELAAAGLPTYVDVDTSLLAETADQVFLAAPTLVPLGGLVDHE
ncbi:MAG: hypothetical protein SX243_24040, partial [Acidobacteriota bacterium]|nr:hypothetical protein [Acidobacteriota bacterium]